MILMRRKMMDRLTQEHSCKGKIYRLTTLTWLGVNGALNTTTSMYPIKSLSCSGCEHCGCITEHIHNAIENGEMTFPDGLRGNGLYELTCSPTEFDPEEFVLLFDEINSAD
jgi:hypothetical protein